MYSSLICSNLLSSSPILFNLILSDLIVFNLSNRASEHRSIGASEHRSIGAELQLQESSAKMCMIQMNRLAIGHRSGAPEHRNRNVYQDALCTNSGFNMIYYDFIIFYMYTVYLVYLSILVISCHCEIIVKPCQINGT